MNEALVCRLCLYNNNAFYNIFSDKLRENKIQQKVLKYLCLEVKEDDNLPKIICTRCLERLESFHQFYEEVSQNQTVFVFTQVTNQPIIVTTAGIDEKPIIINSDQDFIKIETVSAEQIDLNSLNQVNCTNSLTLSNTVAVISSVTINNGTTTTNISVPPDQLLLQEPREVKKEKLEQKQNEESRNKIETSAPFTRTRRKRAESIQKKLDKISQQIQEDELEQEMEKSSAREERKRKTKKKIKQDPLVTEDDEDDDNNDESDYDSENSLFLEGNSDTNPQNDDSEEKEESDNYGSDGVFPDFPKKIIHDSKLMIRGKALVCLMSRFYRLECDVCTDNIEKSKPIFKRLAALCAHYHDAHGLKGYVICCGVKLIKPRAMAMHMSRHLQPDAFKCPECDKMMTCPKILQYHIQNHLPEEKRPLACPDCPRRFSYSSALVAHSISHQPENERAAHICDECGKTFSSPGRLSTHMNVAHTRHGADFVCHVCAKQFACKGNLTYHLTTHQPRMYQVQCEQCGKWLKNKLCLRKHMVQHSMVRYTCQMCEYSALNRQCLRNHMRVQHSDVKPFGCEVCGKTFKLKNTLLNHMVQHTGVRKFACQFCTRTFASSGNYYSHRKRMHPMELAAFKQKQEEQERILRAEAMAGKTVSLL